MPFDDEIIKVADQAKESLDVWQQIDLAKAVASLSDVGLTKPDIVGLLPAIALFIKNGMTVQQAAAAIIAAEQARQKP